MYAFARLPNGQLLKVYDHGDDWQVTIGNTQYWFSVWQADRKDSLTRAITETCRRVGAESDMDTLIIV